MNINAISVTSEDIVDRLWNNAKNCYRNISHILTDEDTSNSPLVDNKKCAGFALFNHRILLIFSSTSKDFK